SPLVRHNSRMLQVEQVMRGAASSPLASRVIGITQTSIFVTVARRKVTDANFIAAVCMGSPLAIELLSHCVIEVLVNAQSLCGTLRDELSHRLYFDGFIKKSTGAQTIGQLAMGGCGMVADSVNLNVRRMMPEGTQDVEAVAFWQSDIQYDGIGMRLQYVGNGGNSRRTRAAGSINGGNHVHQALAYGLRSFDDEDWQRVACSGGG